MKRVFVAVFLAGVAAIAVGLIFGLRPAGPERRSAGHEKLPAYGRGWIPQGVQEIDVRDSGGVVRRVTDPSQVEHIISSFDALTESRSFEFEAACPMIYREPEFFRFRSTNGKERATASIGTCGPMVFVDHTSGATTFLRPAPR